MNIINAIINLVNHPVTHITDYYQGKNRANNAGGALEEYVKDLFANSFDCTEIERLEKISNVFSYTGNNSNPPDAMLRNGDAIEVKKIENNDSSLALNSSYPKHTIRVTSHMISESCKNAEKWTEKDIIYTVGVVKNNNLVNLCMVYGSDYCASDECYSKICKRIKNGVEAIQGIEFHETKELGRINRIDPLGITYMRVRGMWGIENPWKVFRYVYERDTTKKFDFMCIINNSKWSTFTNNSDLLLLAEKNENLNISNIRIKNPDNPAQLIDAKLISYRE